MKPRCAPALRSGLLALALAGTAWAFASPARPGVSAPWNEPHRGQKPDAAQGRFVALGGQFGELSYTCAACHGLDGAGDSSGAMPRLSGQSEWYLRKALEEFASGERPSKVMGPIAAELTPQDIENVSAFYGSLSGVPIPPAVLAPDAQLVKQGRQIASAGLPKEGVPACFSCHGAYGAGSAPYFPFLLGQFQGYIAKALHAFKSGERGGPSNVMTGVAHALSDGQIEALAVYFSSLRPQQLASVSSTTPSQGSSKPAAEQRPAQPETPPPHLGATIHPKPGAGDEVVPGASSAPKR